MKLFQLLEIQRCFAMLRTAEVSREQLSGADYVACVRAESVMNVEINEMTQQIEIKLEAA